MLLIFAFFQPKTFMFDNIYFQNAAYNNSNNSEFSTRKTKTLG